MRTTCWGLWPGSEQVDVMSANKVRFGETKNSDPQDGALFNRRRKETACRSFSRAGARVETLVDDIGSNVPSGGSDSFTLDRKIRWRRGSLPGAAWTLPFTSNSWGTRRGKRNRQDHLMWPWGA